MHKSVPRKKCWKMLLLLLEFGGPLKEAGNLKPSIKLTRKVMRNRRTENSEHEKRIEKRETQQVQNSNTCPDKLSL